MEIVEAGRENPDPRTLTLLPTHHRLVVDSQRLLAVFEPHVATPDFYDANGLPFFKSRDVINPFVANQIERRKSRVMLFLESVDLEGDRSNYRDEIYGLELALRQGRKVARVDIDLDSLEHDESISLPRRLYTSSKLRNFFELQDRFQARWFYGIKEKNPSFYQTASPVAILYSQDSSKETKADAIRRHFAFQGIRDIRASGQILHEVQGKPLTSVVIVRGTGHVGIIPLLCLLSEKEGINWLKDLDFQTNRNIETGETLSLDLHCQISWQRAFWRTVLETSKLTVDKVARDKELEKASKIITEVLSSDPWRGYIMAYLDYRKSTDEKTVSVKLTQEPLRLN